MSIFFSIFFYTNQSWHNLNYFSHKEHINILFSDICWITRTPAHLPLATICASTYSYGKLKIFIWNLFAFVSIFFRLFWQLNFFLLSQVQRVVEFAKRVPGFLDFHQDDQLILIKLGFYEVWLNYIAKTISDSPISTLTFDDGAFLTRQQLEIMFDVS